MRFLSTRTHSIVDYVGVVVFLVLSFSLHPSQATGTVLLAAGIGTFIMACITRYELSLFKGLPTVAHLTVDFLLGIWLIFWAKSMPADPERVRVVLVFLGLVEIALALVTRTRSTIETDRSADELDDARAPSDQARPPQHTGGLR